MSRLPAVTQHESCLEREGGSASNVLNLSSCLAMLFWTFIHLQPDLTIHHPSSTINHAPCLLFVSSCATIVHSHDTTTRKKRDNRPPQLNGWCE